MRERLVLVLLCALVAAAGWAEAATAAPSPRAYRLADQFVKKWCSDAAGNPLYDPDAMDDLAAVFERTIEFRWRVVQRGPREGQRVKQVLPVQRYAAAAEIVTLADWCRRRGLRKIRFRRATNERDDRTPDIQVELEGRDPFDVEVTAVTGRFRGWQYRAGLTNAGQEVKLPPAEYRIHMGSRVPPTGYIVRAIEEKLRHGQLSDGGVLSLHVAGRGESSWARIAEAVKNQLEALNESPLDALEIRSGGTRLELRRDGDGNLAVVGEPDISPGYQEALEAMRDADVPIIDEGGGRGAPFSGPDLAPQGGGGLADALSRETGGIDFTSLELRYVADRKGRGIRYAFRGRPGTADPTSALGPAQDASDAFFVWLALPPDKFWVNLKPTEPDRIIDPVFAQSDAGRVLLEADLALKKVVAPLVHPGSPGGAQFWRELEALYGDRPDQACFSVRQWIVPKRATVHTTGDELYILDAPLAVKMESEFVGGFPGGGCPQGNEAFETAKEEIYRRLILPAVERAVNTAPEFAALRRVYLSRIAAEWFRARHANDRTAIGRIADSGRIRRWRAVTPWNPLDVFNRYLESVRNGEWTYERRVQVNGREVVLSTVFGGVDFSRTPRAKVSRRAFRKRYPRLASRVEQSLRRPTVRRGEVWLGGTTGRQAVSAQRRGAGSRPDRSVRPRFTG